MEFYSPVSLIEPVELSNSEENEDIDSGRFSFSCETYGYMVIFGCWIIFIVTINSIFELWKYIIEPLKHLGQTEDVYRKLRKYFETADYYILSLWCFYVVTWWWAIVSWLGLKLFRHSKGSQSETAEIKGIE